MALTNLVSFDVIPTKRKRKRALPSMENSFCYYKNEKCIYFPCHKTESENFNCMFCFCPLYALGDKCGGNFKYIEGGIKDCSDCLLPHSDGGYAYICSKFDALSELAKKNSGQKGEKED